MTIKDLAESIGIDEDTARLMLQQFEETTLSDLENLRIAVKEKNSFAAAEAAHSINGAALSLELSEIASAAKSIELAARQDSFHGATEAAETIRRELARISRAFLQ
jgi:HPt (histidine-containing phosphotransfer) domain-containing protein